MAAEGLEDEAALQSWFIRRIGDWLHARGRQLVGWDEMLEGGVQGLASDAVVMSWRVRDSVHHARQALQYARNCSAHVI